MKSGFEHRYSGLGSLAPSPYTLDTAAAAKSLQSCPTLCDPIDGSPRGSPDPGILQARTLEWVAISSSNAWKWNMKVKSFSCVWFLATLWTAAYQAPPSMGFSRQEYWSGLPLPSLDTTDTSKSLQLKRELQMQFRTFWWIRRPQCFRVIHISGQGFKSLCLICFVQVDIVLICTVSNWKPGK